MIIPRLADERGKTHMDWLDSRHSFSFSHYHDPQWMGFGPLRVINDDRFAPSGGFGMHGHRDMEILTWIIEGRLAHRDSLGNEGEISRDVAQVMTAGRGIRHSEFNPDPENSVHLLQIWIEPREPGLEPSYADRRFDPAARRNPWDPIASPDGRGNSVTIQQDAVVAVCELDPGKAVAYALEPGRTAWVQIARGGARLNDTLNLDTGDAAALRDEPRVSLHNGGNTTAEILLFDLPPQGGAA